MYSAKELKPIDGQSMATGLTSDPVDVLYADIGAVQVSWSSADAVDATLAVQASVEPTPTNWIELPSGSLALDSAASSKLLQLTDMGYRWVRFVYSEGTNTTGTVDCYFLHKARR